MTVRNVRTGLRAKEVCRSGRSPRPFQGSLSVLIRRVCNAFAIMGLGTMLMAAAPQQSPPLNAFLDDLAASFPDPARFQTFAGPTVFDDADPTDARRFGTPRIIDVAPDGQSAVVLLSAGVAEENSGDQTSLSGDWSGLYRVERTAAGWRLGERIPFGVNRILEHRIAVAIDPATGLETTDRMRVEVTGGNGFPVILNRAAAITSLTVDGETPAYDFQNGILWVAATQGPHQIEVAYRIEVEHPAAGGNTSAFGPEFGHVRNQYYWHPFFGFGEERGRAPISIRATIPERYRLALGLAQTEQVVDGLRLVEAQSAGPIDAVSMSYDSEWQPRTVEAGGLKLTLFATPDFAPSLETIDGAFERATRVLTARFGAPPIDNLSIVQGRARGGSGWHFLSNQGIFAGVQGGAPVRTNTYAVRAFLGHEIAHLWTHPTGWARNFLGEGWATYAESLILADEFSPDIVRQFWRDQARLQWQNPTNMSTPMNADPHNTGVAYAKGAWTLRMLEQRVGRERFDRAMRAYVESAAGGGSYEDFLASFGPQRAEVEAFLAPWVTEPGLPAFSVERAGGELTITQTGLRYLLPELDVRLVRRDGSSWIERVELSGASVKLDLHGADVVSVELDPFETYLFGRRIF